MVDSQESVSLPHAAASHTQRQATRAVVRSQVHHVAKTASPAFIPSVVSERRQGNRPATKTCQKPFRRLQWGPTRCNVGFFDLFAAPKPAPVVTLRNILGEQIEVVNTRDLAGQDLRG